MKILKDNYLQNQREDKKIIEIIYKKKLHDILY